MIRLLCGSLRLGVAMILLQYLTILEVDGMDYIAFSPEFLYGMANMIRSAVGSVFSVGFYIFLILLGLRVFLSMVQGIGGE
jgi:hypothetical protein